MARRLSSYWAKKHNVDIWGNPLGSKKPVKHAQPKPIIKKPKRIVPKPTPVRHIKQQPIARKVQTIPTRQTPIKTIEPTRKSSPKHIPPVKTVNTDKLMIQKEYNKVEYTKKGKTLIPIMGEGKVYRYKAAEYPESSDWSIKSHKKDMSGRFDIKPYHIGGTRYDVTPHYEIPEGKTVAQEYEEYESNFGKYTPYKIKHSRSYPNTMFKRKYGRHISEFYPTKTATQHITREFIEVKDNVFKEILGLKGDNLNLSTKEYSVNDIKDLIELLVKADAWGYVAYHDRQNNTFYTYVNKRQSNTGSFSSMTISTDRWFEKLTPLSKNPGERKKYLDAFKKFEFSIIKIACKHCGAYNKPGDYMCYKCYTELEHNEPKQKLKPVDYTKKPLLKPSERLEYGIVYEKPGFPGSYIVESDLGTYKSDNAAYEMMEKRIKQVKAGKFGKEPRIYYSAIVKIVDDTPIVVEVEKDTRQVVEPEKVENKPKKYVYIIETSVKGVHRRYYPYREGKDSYAEPKIFLTEDQAKKFSTKLINEWNTKNKSYYDEGIEYRTRVKKVEFEDMDSFARKFW